MHCFVLKTVRFSCPLPPSQDLLVFPSFSFFFSRSLSVSLTRALSFLLFHLPSHSHSLSHSFTLSLLHSITLRHLPYRFELRTDPTAPLRQSSLSLEKPWTGARQPPFPHETCVFWNSDDVVDQSSIIDTWDVSWFCTVMDFWCRSTLTDILVHFTKRLVSVHTLHVA